MHNFSKLSEQLGSVSHFKGLSEADLNAIVQSGSVQRYPSGSYVFIEDEPVAGMFVLISGEVHLCKLGPQGQQNIMAVVQPVIMFNEVAVLDGGSNPITAKAVQDCVVWRVPYDAFQDLLKRYPQVGLGLLRVLATRNRMLISHYHDLAFRTVLARTAKLLLELSSHGRQPIHRREHSIAEMASRIATVPEAISRSIKEISSQGLVAADRSTITILDPAALASLAQVEPYYFYE